MRRDFKIDVMQIRIQVQYKNWGKEMTYQGESDKFFNTRPYRYHIFRILYSTNDESVVNIVSYMIIKNYCDNQER